MTLLRAAYRTMLASYFITSGVKALRDPDSLVPVAEPLADRMVPMIKEYAPQQVAGFVPEDARTLVRVNGATQVVGRLALASGKGRRMGALLLAGSLVPRTSTSSSRTSACSAECCWPRGTPRAGRVLPGGPRRAARRSPRPPARPPTSWP